VLLAVLVFVPIRYVYPSRSRVAPHLTNGLGVIWAALMLVMLWQYPAVSRALFLVSLIYPIYYFGLSFWLNFRRNLTPL